jgi:hypothetical protein
MKLTANSQFIVTLVNDTVHGYKKGKVFHPKGLYWHKKNIIIVGDKGSSYPIRLAIPAKDVEVEVLE